MFSGCIQEYENSSIQFALGTEALQSLTTSNGTSHAKRSTSAYVIPVGWNGCCSQRIHLQVTRM